MALNIKDPETERLVNEVAAMTGETKTRAVRVAMEERRQRLARRGATPEKRQESLMRFLTEEVWPHISEDQRGRSMTKDERERILGFGPEGY
jgi:antitoxin VapB